MLDSSKVYLSPSASFRQLLILSMHSGRFIQVSLISRRTRQPCGCGVVVYEGTSKVVGFVRTVGFISCCWGKIFHTTWLHSIGDLHHINIIIDFRKTSLKTQKSPYLHKMRQSPWFKLIAHHLIFYSWSKLMSLIRGILGVMVWRAKKYVQ